MKITKTKFLEDVRHEIEMLKKYTTKEEKQRLNIKSFDPTSSFKCIYGQIAGICINARAKELMDWCCIRVMDFKLNDQDSVELKKIYGASFSNPNFRVNGPYTGQTWDKERLKRNWNYFSALEGYILLNDAKIKNVIDYIKGLTNTLTL